MVLVRLVVRVQPEVLAELVQLEEQAGPVRLAARVAPDQRAALAELELPEEQVVLVKQVEQVVQD